VTRLGRTFLVVTVGVGVGAMNTGNNLLYLVLGTLLSAIVVSGVLSERCLRGLEVRRIGTDGAFAGEPFPHRWALFRRTGASFALEISEEHPALPGSALVPYLAAGEELTARADVTAARRGPYLLREVRVTTRFPFGLFAKSRMFELPGELRVLPRRVPSSHGHQGSNDGVPGDAGNPGKTNGAGDVAGLSPLREGDDARHIHGLRSAALGHWVRLDREREERRTHVLEATDAGPPERVDRACEQLAARARSLLAAGHEVGLLTPRTRIPPASGPGQERRILEALTVLGFRHEERG
jgi:uncharacterized protein (DUF58 family)